MDQNKFGVNLKRTGMDTRGLTSTSSTSTSRVTRTPASIHTPLKPASVSDLKAKFDSSQAGGGGSTATSSSSGRSSPRSSGTTSPHSAASSPGHSVATGRKSDTSISAPSARGLSTNTAAGSGSAAKSSSTTFSSSITSKSSSGSRDNGFPSRINITTTSSASETLTRILGSKLDESSSKIERTSSGPRPWSSKLQEGKSSDSKPFSQGLQSLGGRSLEKKDDDQKEKRVEIPVQHVTNSAGNTKSSEGAGVVGKNRSELVPSRFSGGQGVSSVVKTFQQTANSSSRPEKKTVTSGYLNVALKSSTDKSKPGSATSKTGTRTIVREIPVERVPSPSNKTETSKAQQSNNKLRASLEREKKLETVEKPKNREARPLSMRQLSSERFERLKFDFERGVPTESHDRSGLGSTDHIELQIKAREMNKPKAKPEETDKKKEESIFAQGMKVSDFVKHINTVHPPPKEAEMAAKKWKVDARRGSKTSSQQDVGGENEYIEMPDEESDGQEGIYEFVGENQGGDSKGDTAAGKTPGRRHGVYRKEKGRRASGKVKKEGAQSNKDSKTIGTEETDLNDSQEIVISSGEDKSDSDHSGSTNYEPVDEDNLYEDPDTLDVATAGKTNKKDEKDGKSLGNKLKKNVDKATNYLNKKFNKKKPPKDGSAVIPGGTGTDSEGDVLDDDDVADISSLSRTSSERSSGRLNRRKDRDLTVEVPKMQVDEMDGSAPTPPPPPLPPRASRIATQPNVENSPPLPPRNPMASGSNLGVLDVVVPITPPPSRHSLTADDRRKKSDRFSFGRDTDDGSDSSMYDLARPDSAYLEFDPATPRTLEKMERKDSAKKLKFKSVFSKTVTSSTSQRSSHSYIYPDNISDWPELTGDSDDEDLYIELADDQIYGTQERPYSTKFESEPLYQWYTKDHIIHANRQASMSGSEDSEVSGDEHSTGEKVYEDVERLLQRDSTRRGRPDTFERNAPERRSVIMDVFGKKGALHRALWCEMPEVVRSVAFQTMDPQEKKIQESMFEIMTSEASYLKSLNVLICVFLMAPEFSADMSDRCVITKRERQFLFSNIGTIRDISAKFLADLEARWQQSCIMDDICDIIAKHAEKNFEPYIRYCSNQAFQERALETLQKRSDFHEAVKRLEQNPDCQFLPMSSFLLLPMQRITRLPLLVDAIRHRVDPDSKRHESATKALDALNRVVKQCNEGAKKMLQTEQMCLLAKNIEFSKVKEFPLVSSSRYLVKQGELNKIVTEGTSRIPFGKALGKTKEHLYLYLFNDILLVTKKRGNVYQVRDYCLRNELHTESIDSTEKSKFLPQGAGGAKNLFLLALLSNHEGKQVEMVLSAKSESERTRWLNAILPQQVNPEYERIYEDWDCPQVQCVEKYIAQEPDELTLEESDVINVFKKMADGWYEGERIRDGERGWFPADHTEEINNSHVRARNLRLRYRLMIASQEYTDMNFPR